MSDTSINKQFETEFKNAFQSLYDRGIELIKSKFTTEDIPQLTIPEFNDWYQNILKDIKLGGFVDKSRFRKIIQHGNFGIPQPTGGFTVRMTKEDMISQYNKAIEGNSLMVMTEPFSKTFLGENPPYKYELFENSRNEKCGVYSNLDGASIKENKEMNLPSYRVIVFEVTKNEKTINIACWHGNSSGEGNIQALRDIIAWAITNNIHYVTGDSNITKKKSFEDFNKSADNSMRADYKDGITLEEFLNYEYPNYQKVCSTRIINKERTKMDIFMNNQIEKGELSSEVDGMFIIKIPPPMNVVSENFTAGGSTQSDPLIAFDTEYTDLTPILADHSVVKMDDTLNMFGDKFILLSATGTLMDDKKNGVFLKKNEWDSVDLVRFHENIGIPYTKAWIEIYNQWATIINRDPRLNKWGHQMLVDINTGKFITPVEPTTWRGGKLSKKIKTKQSKTKKRKRTKRKRTKRKRT